TFVSTKWPCKSSDGEASLRRRPTHSPPVHPADFSVPYNLRCDPTPALTISTPPMDHGRKDPARLRPGTSRGSLVRARAEECPPRCAARSGDRGSHPAIRARPRVDHGGHRGHRAGRHACPVIRHSVPERARGVRAVRFGTVFLALGRGLVAVSV